MKKTSLLREFAKINGVKFIALNNYLSEKSGEIANHIINVGISIENAKLTDLNRLNACTDADIQHIAETAKIALETVKTAFSEMVQSANKNLSENIKDRSTQSQAQTDAYITVMPGLKLHKDTMQLHIFGQAIKKTVVVAGEYKTVNSSDKTLAKNAIKKFLDLRSDKFRNFILGNVNEIKMNGETLLIG